MKKLLCALLVLTVLIFCSLAACAESTSPAISFSEQEVIVQKGKTLQLQPVLSTDKVKLTWQSADPKIATVANGKVTGKSGGHTTITCSYTGDDGESVSASCNVTVQSAVTAITPVSKQVVVNVGSTSEPLQIKIQPADATCQDVAWSSEDETVATVDREGKVTGLKQGKVNIVAVSTDPLGGDKPKSCKFAVAVNQGAEKLTISGSASVAKGKTEKLTWTVSPENTTNKKILWTSSNEKVAKVAANGVVSAKGVGKCTITGTMQDGSGVSDSIEISVYQAVTGVQPGTTKRIIIVKGDTTRLSVKVAPKDATNQKMSWSSSSSSVAKVTDGSVTGVSEGECTITAASTDGSNKKATFKVVVEPVNPIVIEDVKIYYYYGWDINCLQVFPRNKTKTRTVKTFRFDLDLYNASGKIKSSTWCEWSGGGFRAFGPNQRGNAGSWHWYGITGITSASKIGITVTQVKYTDGTTQYIPSGSRRTFFFY